MNENAPIVNAQIHVIDNQERLIERQQEEITRLKNDLGILKLKARKVVQKKKDADTLGHTSAFARAVNELEAVLKELK